MGQTSFDQTLNQLKHWTNSNMIFWTLTRPKYVCSLFGNWTRTPYFCLWMNGLEHYQLLISSISVIVGNTACAINSINRQMQTSFLTMRSLKLQSILDAFPFKLTSLLSVFLWNPSFFYFWLLRPNLKAAEAEIVLHFLTENWLALAFLMGIGKIGKPQTFPVLKIWNTFDSWFWIPVLANFLRAKNCARIFWVLEYLGLGNLVIP